MEILSDLEKEVYIADYTELGAMACRILVPGYSEIYETQDLIWDNNNKGLAFRSDILNIHSLKNRDLLTLVKNLEESELDDYMLITDLIGVVFDENTPWGKCTIGELRCLIYLALGKIEAAKDWVEMFLQYNDNVPIRRRFYQVLDIVLTMTIQQDIEIQDYIPNLTRMYGEEMLNNAMASVKGEMRFFGLTRTNMNLQGNDKHLRLIESYRKLQVARGLYASV